MSKYYLNYLDELESEAIYILREVYAQFQNPVILFSGGKDSILVTHLAKKAFHPNKIPFPLLHIDTGHNFPETIQFRDKLVADLGVQLLVGSVQKSIDTGRVAEERGKHATRNALQTTTLLDAIEENKIDCAIGGGRRDEEKARAKERFFSHRDDSGNGTPKTNAPNFGTFSTESILKANTLEHFPLATGPKWMFGITSEEKILKSHRSILPTSAK